MCVVVVGVCVVVGVSVVVVGVCGGTGRQF